MVGKQISYEKSLQIIEAVPESKSGYELKHISDINTRVLAQDIIASHNNPEYETAAMDGFAIKHGDMDKRIKIICDNPAGSGNEYFIGEGECIKTFTGSLMPKGSDTLVPIENVEQKEGFIIIKKVPKRGFALRKAGETYKKDELLIKKDTSLTFAQIGVLASLNLSYVNVYKKPRVAIISSGSEILDIAQKRTNPSQIRSSNHIVLEVLAKNYGCDVMQLGVVKDDKELLTQKIKNGLRSSDIVVTTGGVSVGDYDFTKEVIEQNLGFNVLFHGVNIKPGQHLLLAQKKNRFILALPGFAYSATVTFLLYFPKLLKKFTSGVKELEVIKAILKEDYVKPNNKKAFVAVNLVKHNNQHYVDLEGKKDGSSAILTNFLNDAVLMVLDEDVNRLNAGQCVEVIKLN